ncbi:MAG: hypothetical protein DRN66_01585 [Candidatus Nanohalarchaeota archaeon]|nr:MAG: hypothetical protein DRN66_01585 [Candidatus Nanohaloarchaeota archaeon]
MDFLSAFLTSIHDLFAKKLLEVYDPFSFYFIRCGLCAVIFIFLYSKFAREKFRIPKTTIILIMITNIAVIIRYVFMYWSYQSWRLVHTSLLMCFAPAIILVGSFFFLGEKMQAKK